MLEICRGLTLSNPPTDRQSQTCDLREVVELAARTSLASFREKGRLTLELDNEVKVRGSRHKIGQVVLNLIVNAFQALEDNKSDGTVSATLKIRNDRAVLEVRDNGRGMSEREQKSVFHPFYTTKDYGGTGLGLAISRAIVKELSGELECESAPGEGSTFRMTLAMA
jgi:signal transduction histidine kinase